MKLVIVRHADAGDAEEFAKTTGKDDALRPLTDKGIEQTKSIADGLRKLVPSCDLIVSSPYTRAQQTAEILIKAYEQRATDTTAVLEPAATPSDFVEWMSDHHNADVVMIVGHEPHLSTLATWLMAAIPGSRIELKKAGACLLAFEGDLEKGKGMLQWLMGPKQLSAIA
jgi:phosphohistidine phosphatase